jgi:hypothetical protein
VTNDEIRTILERKTKAVAGGPVALAYSRFDAAMREEAHAEYLTSIEPFRGPSGYAIPGQFVIALARKD